MPHVALFLPSHMTQPDSIMSFEASWEDTTTPKMLYGDGESQASLQHPILHAHSPRHRLSIHPHDLDSDTLQHQQINGILWLEACCNRSNRRRRLYCRFSM